MSKTILSVLLPFLMLFSNGAGLLLTGQAQDRSGGNTGTLEKMIVANGSVVPLAAQACYPASAG